MNSTECPIAILKKLEEEIRKAGYPYSNRVADGIVLAMGRLTKCGFRKDVRRENPEQLSFLEQLSLL